MLEKTVIKAAIQSFLTAQADKTAEKHYKEFAKAEKELSKGMSDNRVGEAKIATLVSALKEAETLINVVRARYEIEAWVKTAAENFTKQISFGTHISKGIHPSSRGDNIISNVTARIPLSIIGTHSINIDMMDMTGNAAALPLYDFLEYQVDDNHKIKDLIVSDNPELIESLSADIETAQAHHSLLKELLLRRVESPVTSSLNKQILFPINTDSGDSQPNIESLEYTNLIPLMPSVLCRAVYKKVRDIRSDENFNAEMTRYSNKATAEEQIAYPTIRDLAVINIGGAKPQNVSKLVQMQHGNLTLLPSLPPIIKEQSEFFVSKYSDSLFKSNLLDRHTHQPFQDLYAVVNSSQNNAAIKLKRDNAVELIVSTIFDVAQELRSRDAGWLSDHSLNLSEKLWLDPESINLADNEWIANKRKATNWQDDILNGIALYINDKLKKRFPDMKDSFGATTVAYWRSSATTTAKNYKLKGKEVLS